MWIMGQNEKSLFLVERFCGIHVYKQKDRYQIVGIDRDTGAEIGLAEYDSEEKSKEVLIDLLTNIDKTRYVMPLN